MTYFLAMGPPGEPHYSTLLLIAQLLALLPASTLLIWALQPRGDSLIATSAFTRHRCHAWRAARLALGSALAGVIVVTLSLLARGFRRNPEAFIAWLTPTLHSAGCLGILCIVSYYLYRQAPRSPRHPWPALALLLVSGLGLALWAYDRPHLHRLWLQKAALLFGFTLLHLLWLAVLSQETRPALPRFLKSLTRIALPALVLLPLSWHTARSIAAWQDQRTLAWAEQVISLIRSHQSRHPRGHAPFELPPEAFATAPSFSRCHLIYQYLGDQFILTRPLALHPGAAMQYDSDYPRWVWHGASDW